MVLKRDIALELERYFPEYNGLRSGQEEIIERILEGKNILAIMPTGSGKSLCYQLPALLYSATENKGIIIVISPLLALMQDQYNKLSNRGAKVELLNSSLDYKRQKQVLRNIANNEVDILFVAPERLYDGLFLAAIENLGIIKLCVVDEAHCISEWGHDFRGDYLNIPRFLKEHGNPQVIALTATAGEYTKNEIVNELDIEYVFDNFPVYRDNLILNVQTVNNNEEKIQFLDHFLPVQKMPGIIYTTGRDKAEMISGILKHKGIKADYFHSERKISDKERVFNDFLSGKIDILCATKAFGMGVDKQDIRFIIHYQIPESIESYWQEVRRGGRDDKPCNCVLLYLKEDVGIQKRFISDAYPRPDMVKKIYRENLRLGPLKYINKPERDIPIEQFFEEKAAILLRRFEDASLISRQGELISQIEVSLNKSLETPDKELITFIKEALSGNNSGIVNLANLAKNIGSNEMQVLNSVYKATVDNSIDIGTRQFRYIRYYKLKEDIEDNDLHTIEKEMSSRREYKLNCLDRMVNYINTNECRASYISQYFNKSSQKVCGTCDICKAK